MRVKLDDVCTRGSSNLKQKEIAGFDGPYPIYGAAGHIGNAEFYHQEKTYVAVVKDGAGIGRTLLLPAKSSVIGTLQYLQPKNNVLPEYLYYAVCHMHLEKYFSGATIPHIYFRDYKNEVFNLDSIENQKKIITILNHVTEVISIRKRQLAELDTLIKARFVEMFGDPSSSRFDWPVVNIGQTVASCEAGWSGNGTQGIPSDDEVAVLKVSSVTKGYFIPEECKVLDDQENIKKRITPEKGDLLFSRANTREMVGATAIITEDYPNLILPDKLWKIRFCNTANVYYMKYLLSCDAIRQEFSASSTGTSGSMFNVSMSKFKNIKVPFPPKNMQDDFASFVAQIDKSKVVAQKALDKM